MVDDVDNDLGDKGDLEAVHGFKVINKTIDIVTGQEIYVMRRSARMFINTHVSNSLKPQENCKNYYLFTVLRYLSSYGRQYVRFISKRLKKDFNLNLFSAHIDRGIYDEPKRDKAFNNQFKQ